MGVTEGDPAGASVRSLIDRWAHERANEPFLITPEDGRTYDYRAFAEAVAATAARLRACGLAAGDRAAFLLDNGLDAALQFLGAMYAGMVSVPLNAVAGPRQWRYVLEHSGARLVVVDAERMERLAGELSGGASKPRLIACDSGAGPRWPEAPSPGACGAPGPGDAALLLYTSGTTGVPKGAELSHANLVAGGANTALAHQLAGGDRALCVLPLYHINGEVVTVMGPLVSGSSVVMPRRFSAGQFWPWIATHRCTWASVVPTIVSYLLDRADGEPYRFGEDERLAALRFVRSASAALSPAVHRAFEDTFKVPLIETMGLTETCAPILSNPLPPAPRKVGSPGVAFGNEVRVVDAGGAPCPDGVAGELEVRGPNVLRRYWRNEEASSAAFHDGWFRTGDLGFRDADGYYFITGRLKELIIKGGENIAPREVDDVLYQHPAVLEAAAVGVDDAAYGQNVVACVVLREGRAAPAEELRAFCERELGRFKSPDTIYFFDSLPKGPSGKIQRLKLPDLIASGRRHDA